MSKKVQKPELKFTDQLESMVVFNSDAVIDGEGPDWVRIKVHLDLKGFTKFMSRFMTIRDYKKFVLTDYNYMLFKRILQDKVTVRDLIQIMQDKEKLSFLEARALILSFTALLMRRGIIAVEVPKS